MVLDNFAQPLDCTLIFHVQLSECTLIVHVQLSALALVNNDQDQPEAGIKLISLDKSEARIKLSDQSRPIRGQHLVPSTPEVIFKSS